MRNLARATAFASLAVSTPALASSDGQYWQTVNVEVAAGDRFVVSNEVVLRTGGPRGLYEIEDNLMLGYKLNPHVTVALGYTHDPNYLHGDFTVMEHRFRQQVTVAKIPVGPAMLSARMRMEQRWREGQSDTAWRLRPYVKLAFPVGKHTTLVLSHESFVDLNTTPFQTKSGEDRMRNLIAINQTLSKHLNIEVGYLEQHFFIDNAPDNNDHVASVALNASF